MISRSCRREMKKGGVSEDEGEREWEGQGGGETSPLTPYVSNS